MAVALADLARQARVDLLFDRKLVRGLRSSPVRGRLSADEALAKLLAGSGVGYRRTADGAFVLFAAPVVRQPEAGDGAISELLVIGRRTQNVDIRRTANDIQPYKIATHEDLEASHRGNVEEFMRAREPANAQVSSPAQESGPPRSSIDLRGFGSHATLVLVDGRRMPYVPSAQGEFDQADVNGIPLGAIERVETLTSAAGGIYGPSAVGGVVNVVLRRDYRGAELTATGGVTDRGDAAQARIEARLGFTPDDGKTDVMIYAAHAASRPLYEDQRDYLFRARGVQFAADPLRYLQSAYATNGIVVFSQFGPLTLDPELGGAALNSNYTFLPLNFSGTAAERAAVLLANAGKIPLELPGRSLVAPTTLVVTPTVSSGLLNIRHRFGSRFEVYADGFLLKNRGEGQGVSFGSLPFQTPPNAPGNPFGQSVEFRFPAPGNRLSVASSTATSRMTAGFLAELPRRWRATGDYTLGRTRFSTTWVDMTTLPAFAFRQGTGQPGPDGLPPVDPLGDTAALFAAVDAYRLQQILDYKLTDRSRAASLRVAGPVMALPGGPLTATLLVEARRDRVPAATVLIELFGPGLTFELPERAQSIRSGYAELRAPIGAQDADFPFLRGLEVQLAVRHDRTTTTLPDDGTPLAPTNDRLVSIRRDATVYTAGARLFPLRALMLRASLATGELPPTLSDFQTSSFERDFISNGLVDVRRGGRRLGEEGSWVEFSGGSHSIRSAKARTLTVGGVVNPGGRGGPRVSLDYSRTRLTGEIVPFFLTTAQLLAAETAYPERVIRAALTGADTAAGFTAGRVIALDTSVINAGHSVVDAVDIQLDWRLPTTAWGDFRLYGAATWQPTFRQHRGPRQPVFSKIGHIDGPLEWRGNGGVAWTFAGVTVDLNAQYYASYNTLFTDPTTPSNEDRLLYPSRIPAQTYVDLAVRRRLDFGDGAAPLRAVDVRFGIQNLLDKRPTSIGFVGSPGYSYYGDARRRRVELTLSAQF